MHGEGDGNRGRFQSLGFQFLNGGCSLMLMVGVPGQKERQYIPHPGVGGHLVKPGHL